MVSLIHKLINSVWNKEELPDQWKEPVILPVHKMGDKTTIINCSGRLSSRPSANRGPRSTACLCHALAHVSSYVVLQRSTYWIKVFHRAHLLHQHHQWGV
jgi:hypothetical protein